MGKGAGGGAYSQNLTLASGGFKEVGAVWPYKFFRKWPFPVSGGARGHPDRGSSFPDRGAEVSAGSTLPYKLLPPLLRRTTYSLL